MPNENYRTKIFQCSIVHLIDLTYKVTWSINTVEKKISILEYYISMLDYIQYKRSRLKRRERKIIIKKEKKRKNRLMMHS